jgi:rhodanese-related sulfurtransferase
VAGSPDDVASNRAWFEAKLRAERQWIDVARRLASPSDEPGFVLLDVRGRDAFARAHIQGAVCVPMDELDALSSLLPKDRELVSYCWTDT